jgi:hypothetical protein
MIDATNNIESLDCEQIALLEKPTHVANQENNHLENKSIILMNKKAKQPSDKTKRKTSISTKLIQNNLTSDKAVKNKENKKKKQLNQFKSPRPFPNAKETTNGTGEFLITISLEENMTPTNEITCVDCKKNEHKPASPTQRFKLVQQADIYICKLPHSRTVFSKILNIRLLRRWKQLKLILTDTEILPSNVRLNNFFF